MGAAPMHRTDAFITLGRPRLTIECMFVWRMSGEECCTEDLLLLLLLRGIEINCSDRIRCVALSLPLHADDGCPYLRCTPTTVVLISAAC